MLFGVLSCEAEINEHYEKNRLRRNLFSVPIPYQTGKDGEEEVQRASETIQRKAKRRKHKHEESTNQGVQNNSDTHHHLQAAHLAFKASTQLEAVTVKCLQDKGEDNHGTESRPRQLEQKWDLITLAGMRKVVKPKFAFKHSRSKVQPLFDCVMNNEEALEQTAQAYDQEVLIPAQCRFLMADMSKFKLLLPDTGEPGYECIVLDPPWENKSAARAKTYPLVPARRLLSLPVPELLHKDGGLVVLWMTNREKLRRFVMNELLPHWKLQALATWFWQKITDSGDLVSPLGVAHRKPYEQILLASTEHWTPAQPIPTPFSIFSVPGQHSRKPHLGRLLRQYLKPNPRLCELFSRELAKGWTSAGNEVLLFQQAALFQRK